jgi:hypothetical protein
MKLRNLIATLAFVLTCYTWTVTPALANDSCHTIHAQEIGQGQINGPSIFTTGGDVIGGGLLQGTTAGNFTFVTGNFAIFFDGTITFTTHRGTLTVDVTGSIDLITGHLSASGPVVGGTGTLEGATGSLSFDGVENLSTGVFTDDIRGQVCVDLAPSQK